MKRIKKGQEPWVIAWFVEDGRDRWRRHDRNTQEHLCRNGNHTRCVTSRDDDGRPATGYCYFCGVDLPANGPWPGEEAWLNGR